MARSILLINIWFGPYPRWMPAFLQSCATNPDVDWLLLTDHPAPAVALPNVRFERLTFPAFLELASAKTGMPVRKEGYSQVDLKPAYGAIFEDFTAGYDFWGHCDIDLLWGRVRHFVTDDLLERHAILSSRKHATSGHFTLFRNTPEVNNVYRGVPGWEQMFADPKLHAFDESKISRHLRAEIERGALPFSIHWPEQIVVDRPELRACPHGWHWQEGRILDASGREHFYVHFGEWKHGFTSPPLDYTVPSPYYAITRHGIWPRPVSRRETWLTGARAWIFQRVKRS
jgi:hypothetical protein